MATANLVIDDRHATLRSLFALLAAALFFALARAAATGAGLALDEFHLWLIGLLPLAAYLLLSRRMGLPLAEIGIAGWIFALAGFVLTRPLAGVGYAEYDLYVLLGRNVVLAGIVNSLIYTAVGQFVAMLAYRSRKPLWHVGAFALNAACFAGLVFLLP